MDKLNDLLQELGISKVKLAKYLGVSRQMVYNYLDSEKQPYPIGENNKDNAIITNKLISGLYPFKITAVITPITEAAQIPMIFKTTRLLSYSYFSLMIAKDNLPMPL